MGKANGFCVFGTHIKGEGLTRNSLERGFNHRQERSKGMKKEKNGSVR